MATHRHDTQVLFEGLSRAEQDWSTIGNSVMGVAFAGYSLSSAFQAVRTLSPTESTAADIAAVVCTLIADLMRPTGSE